MSKAKMSFQIVDEIRIVGLQIYNAYEKLNQFEINIRNYFQYKRSYQDMVPNDINVALLLKEF